MSAAATIELNGEFEAWKISDDFDAIPYSAMDDLVRRALNGGNGMFHPEPATLVVTNRTGDTAYDFTIESVLYCIGGQADCILSGQRDGSSIAITSVSLRDASSAAPLTDSELVNLHFKGLPENAAAVVYLDLDPTNPDDQKTYLSEAVAVCTDNTLFELGLDYGTLEITMANCHSLKIDALTMVDGTFSSNDGNFGADFTLAYSVEEAGQRVSKDIRIHVEGANVCDWTGINEARYVI